MTNTKHAQYVLDNMDIIWQRFNTHRGILSTKVQEELIPVSTFHICWYEVLKDLCLPLKWPSLAQEENS